MKFSVNIPCFGDFADPRTVGDLARTAEEVGWDGLFVWDHLVHGFHADRPFGDPWMLLTAAALSTSRLRLGTLVTPVARRRPQGLARQVATLDVLSGGRAARWDGVVPLFREHRHGDVPPVEVVRDVLAYIGEQRGSLDGFDVVLGGVTTPASAGDVVGPLAEAGATWWDERQLQRGPDIDSLSAVLRRVEAGPPRL